MALETLKVILGLHGGVVLMTFLGVAGEAAPNHLRPSIYDVGQGVLVLVAMQHNLGPPDPVRHP